MSPAELNARTLLTLSAARGNVNVAAVSKSESFTPRPAKSSKSAATAINLSNSVFKATMLNAPDTGKSVVLSSSISRVITTVDPPVPPVTDIETVPVEPSPPETV